MASSLTLLEFYSDFLFPYILYLKSVLGTDWTFDITDVILSIRVVLSWILETSEQKLI